MLAVKTNYITYNRIGQKIMFKINNNIDPNNKR